MVVFELFTKKCASHNTTHSSNSTPINKSKDVLDELMAMDKNYTYSAKDKSNLNTSSFNLDDIINRMPAKGEIDYKNALLNSLYVQIEYLRNDLSAKNEIIKALISMQNKCPNYTEVKNTSNDKGDNSSVNVESNKSECSYNKLLNPLCESISTGVLESTVLSQENKDFTTWEKHSL